MFLSICLLLPFSVAAATTQATGNDPQGKSSPLSERKIEGPVDIEADRLEYNQQTETYHASGNVIVNFKNGFLIANTVTVNKRTAEAEAIGDVHISDEGDSLEGERIRFNLNTKTGVFYNGKVFLSENHVYLTGGVIEKRGEQAYFLKDATVTTCDGDKPDWRFTAGELDVTIEGYGTLKNGTFQVKNFPILYAPYMIFPAKTQRQSGLLLPSMSYSDLNGFDMEVPFYWAISENMDATFYQRYIQKRGWKEGLEYRYYLGKDTSGTFYGDFLNDSKEIRGADDGLFRDWNGETHRRWSYYLNHLTTFSPGFYIRTDIARVSDPWYFRDFSNYNYYLENYSATGTAPFKKISFLADRSLATLDSSARMVKDWQLYNLTVLARYTDNLALATNDTTLQYYPQVTLTGVRQTLFGSPLNFELSSQYLSAYRSEGQKGQVAEINPVFSLPHNFGDYFHLTPSIGFTQTAWEARGGPENNNASRGLYTLSLYGTTEVHRIFKASVGAVDKVKHEIKPEVTYTYRPNVTQNVPDFVAAIPETNAVTYSLGNYLTARTKEKTGFSYFELLRLKLTQTYNIKEVRSSNPWEDRRTFSPVDIETDLLPGNYLSFHSLMSFDPNDGEWKKLNQDVTLKDNRGDSASIGYRYWQDTLEELNLDFKIKYNKNIDFMYVLRQNIMDKKSLENSFGIDYHKQCWSVLLSYSELDNDRRVMISFALFGLGKNGNKDVRPAQILGRPETVSK